MEGADAIEHLVFWHPTAHHWFGDHPSIEHFALILLQPHWHVITCNDNWGFFAESPVGSLDTHWFCPSGLRLPDLRRVVHRAFEKTGAWGLTGVVPPGHVNERASRVLCRAIGCVPWRGGYILTRERFLHYNRPTGEK